MTNGLNLLKSFKLLIVFCQQRICPKYTLPLPQKKNRIRILARGLTLILPLHKSLSTDYTLLFAADAFCAWSCFKKVISPATSTGTVGDTANVGHNTESLFDIALFEALIESLKRFVDEIIDAEWIVLKNSNIGFGRKIKRRTVGFPSCVPMWLVWSEYYVIWRTK